MSGHTALGHLRKVTAAAVVATAAAFGLIACQDNAEANAPSPSAAAPTDSGSCTTGQLSAKWYADVVGGAPVMSSDEQQTTAVKFENTSDSSCTMYGFPGVQIKDGFGKTWDLQRSAEKPSRVTLKPGGHTYFTIQLLPTTDTGARKVVPATVLVTPPDQKSHYELSWPYGGRLLDQSGATHPGTYVNPVNAS
ncbi:hypothetical protein SBI_05612 [Streptomyces bingchenggensis BCW-1]|uniref:DUF4232 domain-containing protein n=1 Tax=Streptomyces bingchenggensis (strain BCW-1) TaxID=749414 RepID=D7CCK1_STRBB|nr:MULTISPECIES: DUF4232 domain-containing protein [Streptomyces]ADI08732.1 hypothetical protein SBI_05612 [Streptomyces bingchenggensis BCW-1]